MLAQIGRVWLNFGKFHKCHPKYANLGQHLRLKPGRLRPHCAMFVQVLAEICPSLAKFSQTWPKLAQVWPNLGGRSLAETGATSRQQSRNFSTTRKQAGFAGGNVPRCAAQLVLNFRVSLASSHTRRLPGRRHRNASDLPALPEVVAPSPPPTHCGADICSPARPHAVLVCGWFAANVHRTRSPIHACNGTPLPPATSVRFSDALGRRRMSRPLWREVGLHAHPHLATPSNCLLPLWKLRLVPETFRPNDVSISGGAPGPSLPKSESSREAFFSSTKHPSTQGRSRGTVRALCAPIWPHVPPRLVRKEPARCLASVLV